MADVVVDAAAEPVVEVDDVERLVVEADVVDGERRDDGSDEHEHHQHLRVDGPSRALVCVHACIQHPSPQRVHHLGLDLSIDPPYGSPVSTATPIAGVFKALADPTRLAVVERLTLGPASTSELAQPFGLTLPSLLQHLGVLESAGLVTSKKAGRVRTFRLVPATLTDASDWLGAQRDRWAARLDQLDEYLTRMDTT